MGRGAALSQRQGEAGLKGLIGFLDRISGTAGAIAAWLVIPLILASCYEVFSRYVLGTPHAWMLDVQIMLYGVLFMMAGAYTLAKNGHVRGDVLYGFFRPRTQATVDLLLYVLFFIPGVIALTWAGYDFAAESWRIRESSNVTYGGPPYYPFKTVIPIAGALLLLQGIVEIIRCAICVKQGAWPSRERDVEEVDVDELKKMVHTEGEAPGPGR